MHTPLRPHDPRVAGEYELLGLLGEGGMGAVYLARGRSGRPVAVKIIKPEYAAQAEFRGRFRSEVNRARQVPPFCTAAVLDADPDHETPYLVVEYVDGPDLAEVVTGKGPLTGGDLHGVAVGVATALVAIHGAGVIHRDLKPRNVLFALGSPKVIDFGIARALESTSEHTRPDQMVGTLSYMAPERLDGKAASPAVDVFAWGVLVFYAATGRTPFAADSPTATAVRILTAEPDLDGLTGDLRDLVGRALHKDPALRPTAQELLDMLLAGDAPQATAVVAPVKPRFSRVRVAAVAATTLALALGVFLGMRPGQDNVVVAAVPSPSPSPSVISVADPLARPGKWKQTFADDHSCDFDEDGLLIVAEEHNTEDITCPGPTTAFPGDHAIRVTLESLSEDACAFVWFRYDGRSGYQLSICNDSITAAKYEPNGDGSTVSSTDLKMDYTARHLLGIDVAGRVATFFFDDEKVLTAVIDDPALTGGRVGLGMIQTTEDGGAVRFSHFEARSV
ncbi:serine/threonine-protein kinase [Winogradskya humida]|uniref:Protein kinase domain-containing protein n=1 Tax=Winogradskya humida TaxID=113566 RepID=A0ABQ4A588_9ACTN|nr:serine/threonine-protein kinase [Actinoplanes humidus]GIE26000.1 hypothetical protein Ahu01nite_091020 [Actinoplanes humidus]